MVQLTIDGKEVQVRKGATILEAAEAAGVTIPTLCFLKKVSPTGACRVCVVEVEGVEQLMTACNTVVTEPIRVTTRSERIDRVRRQMVELLLVNHPLDCPVCDAGGECDLQDVCYALDVTDQPFEAEDVNHPTIDKWPLIQQVPSRCILCEKCIKVCHEVVGSSSLWLNEKGDRAFIDKHLELCEFCGSCVQVCPTGTMISKPFKFRARPWELTRVPSFCTTCGSHCEIDLHVKGGEVYRVTSEDGVTVNNGNLCIGGFFGFDHVHAETRLKQPLLRGDDALQPASWEQALDRVAGEIRRIGREHGPDSLAGLGSPRLTNEENYLFQKLFRAVIGCNNIDSEARFGTLPAFKVLDQTLGLRGASRQMESVGRAQSVLVFGSDVTAEAPALDWQIEQGCRKRDGKLVVANMRRVKLTRYAESFLQYRPGSEAALADALCRIIWERGWADQRFLDQYLENPEELEDYLKGVDLQAAAASTGLDLALIEEAAEHLGRAGSVAILFGADLTGSTGAEQKVAAVVNLALLTGALHGEAGGLFPIDEKGNTQGLLDMGVCPEWLPGYLRQEAGERLEKAWDCRLPQAGLDAPGILEGIEKGNIRFLYLAGVNPVTTFPEAGRWREAFQKLDCLVVQDILDSALVELAHVVLPGSAYVEKEGTVTSLDQRVNRLRPAVPPPGEARSDWEILAGLWQRLVSGAAAPDLEETRLEIHRLASLYADACLGGPGRTSCLKEPYRPAEKALRFTPVGRLSAEPEGAQLLAGKILFQFGTTSASPACREVAPGGYVELHAVDAASLGIREGGTVRVTSALGSLEAPVRISDNLQPGLAFVPHHFAELGAQQLLPADSNRVAVKLAKG